MKFCVSTKMFQLLSIFGYSTENRKNLNNLFFLQRYKQLLLLFKKQIQAINSIGHGFKLTIHYRPGHHLVQYDLAVLHQHRDSVWYDLIDST